MRTHVPAMRPAAQPITIAARQVRSGGIGYGDGADTLVWRRPAAAPEAAPS